jgi:nitroreductase
MKDVLEIIKNRRSIRKYKSECPDKEQIAPLLEAANWAPSDGNSQPWSFTVYKGETADKICKIFYDFAKVHIMKAPYIPEEKKPLMIEYAKDFGGAPMHIAVSYKVSGDEIKDEEALMAASAAVQNLMLACADKGMGSVWIAGEILHNPETLKLLNLSEDKKLAGIIPVGFPDMDPPATPREDVELKTEWIGF